VRAASKPAARRAAARLAKPRSRVAWLPRTCLPRSAGIPPLPLGRRRYVTVHPRKRRIGGTFPSSRSG
jgi:hypothetical protein